MSEMQDYRVINGTFGSAWINGKKCAEIYSCSSKITGKTEDVAIAGKMKAGKKLMSVEYELTIKFHKVYSSMQRAVAEGIKNGVPPEFKIVSALEDPQAFGKETVIYKGCRCFELDLQTWEVAKKGEGELKFDFEDFEFADEIVEQ